MIKVTYDDVVRTMEEVVADAGEDYVYPRAERGDKCVYVHNMRPDCLVGRVLHRLGVSLDLLTYQDNTPAFVLAQQVIDAPTSQVLRLLSEAQSHQDAGYTWGAALFVARERTAR